MIYQIKKYDWIVICCLFLIAELLINPIGEFPLNDDWAYSKSINDYLETSRINFSFWQAIPDLPQFFIGLTACKLFGFSFTLLRFISITCLVIMIYLFNVILKLQEIKSSNRILLMLLFVFNPLTISLSNTFLPDTIQLFFSLISVYFIFKYLKERMLKHLFLFTLFSVLACLNRQSAIAVPLAFGIVWLWRNEKTQKNFILCSLPFVINLIALIFYQIIASYYNKLPGNYNLQLNNILIVITHPSFNSIKSIGYYFITSTICLGLFILPITISNFRNGFVQLNKSFYSKIIIVVYFLTVLFKIIISGNILPFVGNMLYHLGTGPILISGFNSDEPTEISAFAKILWYILNFIGAYSFYISIQPILMKRSFVSGFFICLIIIYLLPICVNYANDRYLFYLLPFYFLAYYLSNEFQINKIAFLVIFVPLLYFSIASTHNYMAINKARWHATNHLTKNLQIAPAKIDGGFEFNAWHLAPSKNYLPSHKGHWWWVEGDEYVISAKAIKGYSLEFEYPFNPWMPFKFNKILVLHKIQQ